MPYLTELNEWRLIQEIATWLSQRKAPYHALPKSISEQIGVQIDADLLEFELRRTFLVQKFPQNLNQADFKHCQTALKNLCSLLDGLAQHRSLCNDPEGHEYIHLRASIGFLESTSEAIDLVNGPNKRLFKLPNNTIDLRNCLRTITECNDALSGLLAPSLLEPAVQPSRIQRGEATCKKDRIRDRAMFILGTLFEHFRCGMSHEILLKLIQDPDEDSGSPNLQLMLSACPELEMWQEVQCDTITLYV